MSETDQVPLRAPVTVTGSVMVDDGTTYRFFTTTGQWAGESTHDDAVPIGRMTAPLVMPGMSGAPVISADGSVVGVVSGRYNSVDGWLAGNTWVTRTENLVPLLADVADAPMKHVSYSGPVDLTVAVTEDRVRLTGPGIDVSADHGGVRPGLAEAVNETRRVRARVSRTVRDRAQTQVTADGLSLGRAARLLGESFLPEPVLRELGAVLAAAERAHQSVRLGLAVPPELAGLPWEALPGPDGRGPLALHPLVSLYRKADATIPRLLPGPLRIVVAIAAPDVGGAPMLDYERELRNVIAAVRSARQDAADVRVVPFATPAAIRAELDRESTHVLHLSVHGTPGTLVLEDDTGAALPVTADELSAQAIPAGKMPPVIALFADSADAPAAAGGPSLAAGLCQRGAAAVIATEASVSDTYATRVFARMYGTLARAAEPDVVAALAQARREVQRELETSTDQRDRNLAALGEWALVTMLAGAASVTAFDPRITEPVATPPPQPRIAGLASREKWYFVGRRSEQRAWPSELLESPAGLVICGIGGIGKTTLAAEITTRVLDLEPNRVLVSLTGPLTLEGLLGGVTSAVRRELLVRGQDATAIRALDVVARADLGWQDRLAVLRGHVLDHVPVLVILDQFEDNLRPDGDTGYAVGDEVPGRLARCVGI